MAVNANAKTLGYLGVPYQFKLIYNLIWFPKFAKHILPHLTSSYIEHHEYKQLYNLIKNYFDKYSAVPDRHKIEQLITLHVDSEIERDMLTEILNRLKQYSKKLVQNEVENDSQHIQDLAEGFVLQQRLQQASVFLQTAIQNGDLDKARDTLGLIRDAYLIEKKNDKGIRMGSWDARIIKPQYLDAIPTGIPEIDNVTGGLPRGKIGMFVAGQGVGKSSMLTLLANNAYLAGKKVLHLVFDENEPTEIENLHTARWCGIKTKHFPKYRDFVKRKYDEIHAKYKTGQLIIDQLSSDRTTVGDIENYILDKQQELGFEFDLVCLDYVDEINAKGNYKDEFAGQVEVMKSLKSMVVRMNIAFWTACQGTKDSNDSDWVLFKNIGGSVAKIKKAQLIFSAGKSLEQRKTSRVNIALLKCNYGGSGHKWEDCVFKNSILELQFSSHVEYLSDDVLKQGYDEEDENELLALLTPEERARIPEIEAELQRDLEEVAPVFIPPLPRPIQRRVEAYVPPAPSQESIKITELKNLISNINFDEDN
jgi:KaiC/GvpD/RAD55 family RecA-like ATPase